MVKGSDYINQSIIGKEFCGEIAFYDREEEISTSKTIHRITFGR